MGRRERNIANTLIALGVEPEWEPLHRLIAALDVVDGGQSAAEVARRTHHRTSTILRWESDYRANGLDAFLPQRAPDTPGSPTLRGIFAGRLVEEFWTRTATSDLGNAWRVLDARDQDPDPGWDFEVIDNQGRGSFTVDVKLHSELFREAKAKTKLEPEDCVPLGIYKLLEANERIKRGVAPHLYAFLFRPGLSPDVDSSVTSQLAPSELRAAHLLFRSDTKRRRRQERRVAAQIVDSQFAALRPLLQGHEFHVIGVKRAVAIFLDKFADRAPMLRGGGSRFSSTINMHYSWEQHAEMTPWSKIAAAAQSDPAALENELRLGRI